MCSTSEAFIYSQKTFRKPASLMSPRNQILLRATSVSPVSAKDGREVKFVVKRYLKLREPSRTGAEKTTNTANGDLPHSPGASGGTGAQYGYRPAAVQELVDISQLQADLDAQRSDIDRIDNAGFKVVTTLAEAVSRVESDLTKMRHTLSELQQEIKGNHDDMSSLKLEIKNVKRVAQDRTAIDQLQERLDSANTTIKDAQRNMGDATTELRQELAHVKSEMRESREGIEKLRALVGDNISARDHAKEMATIRAELGRLRNQVGESRSKPAESFPSRELDILTSSIAKIGNRASQIENLQMKFEIFKGRIERMEGAQQDRPSLQNSTINVSPYDQYDNDEYHAGDALPARKKRRSSGLDGSSIPGSNSTKRTALISHTADKPNASGCTSSSSGSTIPRLGNARLTKAGKVDKRTTQRPSTRSAISVSGDPKTAAGRRKG